MMKISKQLLMIFVLIVMILVGSIPAIAVTADNTTQQKAEALNSLKIVTSVGEDYLKSELRKSEAVTLIVRTIGKVDFVLENKNVFQNTPFTDVAPDQWYAPYIGYGSEYGFISKDTNQFKPLDYISDKEFIKLVLIALEYREGGDFTSANILDKAIDIGLINVTFYINHMNQNIITTRASAVDILYTALSLKTRTGDKILCQKLIEEGVVNANQLTALGFMEDTTITDILQIDTVDLNKLEIKFNENVTFVSGAKVYDANDDDDILSCSIQFLSGDTMNLLTSTIDVTKDYTVELTGVKDEDGNIIETLESTFKGFESDEITSNFFRISKIDAANEGSIKVYFTHPVSLNSEVCLYYSIMKDNTVIADGQQGVIKAGILNSDKNAVMLSFNSGILNSDSLYTLNIDGNMMSAYGVRMNDGLGDSMKFVSADGKGSRFELRETIAIDEKTLLLQFSKEVNSFLAKQIFNFYVTDENNNPLRISSTVMNDNGKGIYINLEEEMTKDEKYYLTINNLNDITKQEYITEQRFTFEADFGSTQSFKIRRVNAIDNQTIELTFSRPLDEVTATELKNYTIYLSGGNSGKNPEKVFYNPDEDPYVAKLYLSRINSLSKENYEIKISNNMKDYLGNSVSVTGERFKGTNRQKADIAVDEIVPISTDSVKVTFTQEIAFNATNLAPSNYILEYVFNRNSIKKIPISVIYIDSKTLILKFDALHYDTEYMVKIVDLIDFTGASFKGLQEEFELYVD